MNPESRVERIASVGQYSEPVVWPSEQPVQQTWLLNLATLLAQPRIAGIVALLVYLLRASLNPYRFQHTQTAYFNLLADAFLQGQLHLRLSPWQTIDLVQYGDRLYLYWPPFPAVLLLPLVALFGVTVSDVIYTAVFAAVAVALVAKLLALLDRRSIAPLTIERRGILVATVAFGSVLFVMAPSGAVWFTSQIIGLVCVLVATVAALAFDGKRGYLLVGLALACAMATRNGLIFSGVWLVYYLWQRDRWQSWRQRAYSLTLTLAPIIITVALLGWYNAARFGHPLELGLAWHKMSEWFRADYQRYGVFNLHYLPTNLYHHFIAPPMTLSQKGTGGGFFWMSPVFCGALYAIWQHRRTVLVWALVLTCLLIYIPIGLVMGTGYYFGSRYLLDLLVPLTVLTALGIRRWRLDVLQVLLIVSVATHVLGSILLLLFAYYA